MMYEELCDAWVDAHGEKEHCLRMRRRLTCMVMLLVLHVFQYFPSLLEKIP